MPKALFMKFNRLEKEKESDEKSRMDLEASETSTEVKSRHSKPAMPPTPPSNNLLPPLPAQPVINPLNEFAEISLAASGFATNSCNLSAIAAYAALMSRTLPAVCHNNELTPSNSPSPPPAHVSPVTCPAAAISSTANNNTQTTRDLLCMRRNKTAIVPPAAHVASNPFGLASRLNGHLAPVLAGNSNLSSPFCPPSQLPAQSAPEDLRVVGRQKIDFPLAASPAISASTAPDSTGSLGEVDDRGSEYADSLGGRSSNDGDRTLHGEGGHHECQECGKTYSTSSNLARHRQTHRSLDDKKARKCPHCEKTYVSMPAYSMHIRTHNQGCKCHFCGKSFSRPWLLQGHIRTHTGEKPFSCHICEKSFADKSNLRAHIQTHSNTKPYICGRCNKAFALKSYLYKHEESSCMKMLKGGASSKPRRKSSGGATSTSTMSLTPSPPLGATPSLTPAGTRSAAGLELDPKLILAFNQAREAFRLAASAAQS